MAHQGFHHNRYKVGKTMAILFLIFISYTKRDLLQQTMQMSIADNNLLQDNPQQIVVQNKKLIIGSNLGFMKTVDYHSVRGLAFVIYKQQPSFTQPIAFCGANVEILFKEESLDVIDSIQSNQIKSTTKELKFESGTKQEEIFKELQQEIPYARKGDVIYGCKNLISYQNRSFAPSDIVCQSIKIQEVQPFLKATPPLISYISVGKQDKTQCKDVISIEYSIKTDHGKTLKRNAKMHNITIGNGQVPIQIEQALLRIGVGGKVVLRIKNGKNNLISFYGVLQDESENTDSTIRNVIINNSKTKQDLIFYIKRIA